MTWLSFQIYSFCRDPFRPSSCISSLTFPRKSLEANRYTSRKFVSYYNRTTDTNTVLEYKIVQTTIFDTLIDKGVPKRPYIRPITRSTKAQRRKKAFTRLFYRGKWIIKLFLYKLQKKYNRNFWVLYFGPRQYIQAVIIFGPCIWVKPQP